MLEPLFRCNLACAGCGKIDYPDKILNQRLSVAQCLEAVDECGAPVVSIAGGEPLVHSELPQIVEGIIARKKFVYVCTNALLMEKKLSKFKPNPYFVWSIHLDGDRDMHDQSVCEEGVYDKAVAAIAKAKARGLPHQHELHAVRQCQARPRRQVFRQREGPRHRRHHGVARLRLRARARPGALPQPHAHQAAVPRHLPQRQRHEKLVVQPVQPVPRFPRRQSAISLHALGQPDAQRVRLAEALLPARRRLRRAPSRN